MQPYDREILQQAREDFAEHTGLVQSIDAMLHEKDNGLAKKLKRPTRRQLKRLRRELQQPEQDT